MDRLHHAYPPSYNRDVPGLVDDLEEEMSMTTDELAQVRGRLDILCLSIRHSSPSMADHLAEDRDALLAHIATLEARNEAMAAVVAAARRLIDADTVYEERRPLIDALAVLDAQAGEVT